MKRLISLLCVFVLFTGCSSASSTKTATCTESLESGIRVEMVLTQGKDDRLEQSDMTFVVPYTPAMITAFGGVQKIIDNILEQMGIKEGNGVSITSKDDDKKNEISITVTIDLSKADKNILENFSFDGLSATEVVNRAKQSGATCTDFK